MTWLTSTGSERTERQIRREAAELVFHYPQFTLEDAVEMPDGDRRLLLTFRPAATGRIPA